MNILDFRISYFFCHNTLFQKYMAFFVAFLINIIFFNFTKNDLINFPDPPYVITIQPLKCNPHNF